LTPAAERGAALVTGAGRRIGRVLALAMARSGFDVAIHHHRSADDALSLAEEIRALGRKASVLTADLADEGQARALIGAAGEALGPVTLLVNNASVFEDDRVETFDDRTWRPHIEVNLHAPLILAQAFAAALPADRQGLILNLLDQRVWRPNPQFFTYGLSKAALWAATRTLAQALAPRIRVNGIGPGPTLPSIHQTGEAFQAEAANVPLARRADPAEIVAAALYLVDAPSVTGQMIAVDGGQHLAWRTPDVILHDGP
jgi:NAD(P)-dependent dehydrogenase (short-subunit alcohol dehydrogenase family)